MIFFLILRGTIVLDRYISIYNFIIITNTVTNGWQSPFVNISANTNCWNKLGHKVCKLFINTMIHWGLFEKADIG